MWIHLFIYYQYYSCADQESFVRGGPTLTFFVVVFVVVYELKRGERGTKYHYKSAIIDPPANCHLKWLSAGVPMMA